MSIPPPVLNWIDVVTPINNPEYTISSDRSDRVVVCEMILHQIEASPNKDLDIGQLIDAVKAVQRLKLALANAKALAKPKVIKPQ